MCSTKSYVALKNVFHIEVGSESWNRLMHASLWEKKFGAEMSGAIIPSNQNAPGTRVHSGVEGDVEEG